MADAAGVSRATTSRALSNYGYVSDEVRAAVAAAAELAHGPLTLDLARRVGRERPRRQILVLRRRMVAVDARTRGEDEIASRVPGCLDQRPQEENQP